MSAVRAFAGLACALGVCAARALTLTAVGEAPLPGGKPTGLSGITWAGGDRFYAVKDSGGWVFPLTVGIDRRTGAVTNCAAGAAVRLRPDGAARYVDFEGCAWDAARGVLWTSDEYDASVTAWRLGTGRAVERVKMPAEFDAFRFNRSLEALTLRPDGLELWTCNEEALCAREARGRHARRQAAPMAAGTPEADDGPRATRAAGTRVRLQKFTRDTPAGSWRAAGQWAYETDAVGGRPFLNKARCGVSGLCALADGTVLVLERELSVKGALVPSFRCRVYRVDFAGASDTTGRPSARGGDVRACGKTRVFDADTGFAMYEGICLGPELADGARSVLLVSDGDDGAAVRLFALRLAAD